MRELSLHILDLLENSIRAEASVIELTLEIDAARDLLRIVVEDNGRGLSISRDEALDPFRTTKAGKKTGLGLSLFRAAAEQAGGSLQLSQPAAGGVKVEVTMGLTHVDRNPLGDLAGTLSGMIWTNPGIDFRVRVRIDGREKYLSIRDLAAQSGDGEPDGLAIARKAAAILAEELRKAPIA